MGLLRFIDTTLQRIEVDRCFNLRICAASDLVSCTEDTSLLIFVWSIPFHLRSSPSTESPWEISPWALCLIEVIIDLIKAPAAVANILVFDFLELEHVPEKPLDVDIPWPQ